MPRNNDIVYVPVGFPKNSPVLARLREEAKQAQHRSTPYIGPYIANLLADRDQLAYGGEESAVWLANSSHLMKLVEMAVQKALVAAIPSILVSGSLPQAKQEIVEVASEEDMDQEAAAMAASFDDWGDDE